MAEAILLKDVDDLGSRGDVVNVSGGYLRNFLVPRKLAQPATRGAIEAARAKMEAEERATREAEERADEHAALLNKTVLTIPHQAGEDVIKVVGISKDKSIVNFWTIEPKLIKDKISFEGVILNPGFQSENGFLFRVTFEARNAGMANLRLSEGALLANDGLGTNVLADLGSTNFKIVRPQPVLPTKTIAEVKEGIPARKLALPVIIEYPSMINTKDAFTLRGKGEPGFLTRIVFKDLSAKSIGERFIERLQTKKKRLDEALVKNDESGSFEYVSPNNLVAGVYNATPFLVDEETNIEKPGFGAQLLVSDSKLVRNLVVVINVLGLLIPIVLLCVIIYFIPWYSWLRMRILRKKMGLEEEKIDISEHQLKRQDKILDQTVDKIVEHENKKQE